MQIKIADKISSENVRLARDVTEMRNELTNTYSEVASLKTGFAAYEKERESRPKTSPAKGKAGRIVGISKDENEYIQQVLQMIADDSELGASNPNYVKIQARYNK